MNVTKALAFGLFISLLLSSCGWYLRGAAPISGIIFTSLSVTGGGEVRRALETKLRNADQPALSPSIASYKLSIDESREVDNVSLDDNARASEIEAELEIRYSLLDSDNLALAEDRSITVQRIISVDANNLNASETELEETWQQLTASATSQLIRQLSIQSSLLSAQQDKSDRP